MFVLAFYYWQLFLIHKEIPCTLDDRNRLIRMEEGLKGINQRIDSLEKRIDGLQGLKYVIIGAIIAQTIAVVGFSLRDRRSTLLPITWKTKDFEGSLEMVKKETKELRERGSILENAIREYAKYESNLY